MGKSLGTDVKTVYCRYFSPIGPAANDNVEPEARLAIPRANVDPFDVSKHDGLLQKITEWILDTARVPVPEFATISALSYLLVTTSELFTRRVSVAISAD